MIVSSFGISASLTSGGLDSQKACHGATWASDPFNILVHNGAMKLAEKAVRQSICLPLRLAKQVGSMAKSRKLSKNRMLLELLENGIDAEKR